MFSIHSTPGEFKNTTVIISYFRFMSEENLGRKITCPGVSNGSIQFNSAHNIWPLLQLLAKNNKIAFLVLACSCLQKFLSLLVCTDSR